MLRLVMMMVVVSMCAATEDAVFAEKYGALFEYMNLNKSGGSVIERVNKTDFLEYIDRLNETDSNFTGFALSLAAFAYPAELQTYAGQTKSEFIDFMNEERTNGNWTSKTSDLTYDVLILVQKSRGQEGSLLLKSTLREYEETLNSLTEAETNAYFAKLPSGDTVTATALATFYDKYMNWGNFTRQDMPMFGLNE